MDENDEELNEGGDEESLEDEGPNQNDEKSFGEALIKVREESKMSIDENEEIGYEPDVLQNEEGSWVKGKHDQLAIGLAQFPYSRYYYIYLGTSCLNPNKLNGPSWFIEK